MYIGRFKINPGILGRGLSAYEIEPSDMAKARVFGCRDDAEALECNGAISDFSTWRAPQSTVAGQDGSRWPLQRGADRPGLSMLLKR